MRQDILEGRVTPQEWASLQLQLSLLDEVFFFKYHMKMTKQETLSLPIHERKWLANRYLKQRDLEKEHMEQQRRQSKAKH